MITLGPVLDKDKLTDIYKEKGFPINENSGCVLAKCGEEIIGYSLYDLDESKMVVLQISPENDLALADGILRSTLHIAAERSIMDAFCQGEEIEKLCEKLMFFKCKQSKSLEIEKLFQSCCGCN